MERATLLRMLRENRAFFDQTVALVSDERMREPPREGHWSGKDILAHVTTWERRLLGWLAAAARDESAQIPEPGATWDDMDRLNAVSYAANRDRALEDITADSRRSFAQVLAQIEAFSDDDLSDPTRFPWLDRQPLWRRIAAGPGYGHYQAHLYDLWERIAPERRFAPTPAQLAACAGRYVDREGGTVTFAVEGDHLVARRSWEPGERVCVALDDLRYAYHEGGLFTFSRGADGRVSATEVWTYRFAREPVDALHPSTGRKRRRGRDHTEQSLHHREHEVHGVHTETK